MSISPGCSSFDLAGPQDQPARHARRPELRRRRARRAARVRVGRLRRQRGDGRRGLDDAAVGARGRARHRAHDPREHARPRAGRLLPHARALKAAFGPHVVATEIPIGRRARRPRRHRPRRHEGLRVRRATPAAGRRPRDPDPRRARRAGRGVPREAHGRGRRGLRGAHGALPRGRGDLPRGDRRRPEGRDQPRRRSSRSSAAWPRATSAPTACSTRSSRTSRRRSSTGRWSSAEVTLEPVRRRPAVRLRVQDEGRPVRRAHQLLPRLPGRPAPRHPGAQHPLARQGAPRPAAAAARQGDRARRRVRPGRHRRGGQAQGHARRRLARRARRADHDAARSSCRRRSWPSPSRCKAKGDEDKLFTLAAPLQEEDPTIDLHRDPQTGEEIVAGLSQVHVEVLVDRLRSRFGVEVDLKPPRVPYQETIRGRPRPTAATRSRPAGAASSATAASRSSRSGTSAGFEFVDAIKGGVIPHEFIPAVEKGVPRGARRTAPWPASRSRACASGCYDGSYHTVDSSEMAFQTAGALAMREALGRPTPVLLEPVMLVTLSVPEDSVGDVIGDLNSRRGRPLGMEPVGGHDRGQGRGPDGRDAQLRAGPAGADRRARRLHDGVRAATRRCPAHLAQKVVAEAWRRCTPDAGREPGRRC